MTPDPKKPRPLSPAEVLARFDRREGRPTARDRKVASDVAAWRAAEQPLLDELRAVDVVVDSVWDLVDATGSYPNAVPVLVDHLERGGYPDRVVEGMARALAVRRSLPQWDRIVALLRRERRANVRAALAGALAACATSGQLDELVELLRDRSLGPARAKLVAPVLVHGGRRGRRVVAALRDDSDIGDDVVAELERRPLRPPR